ncbi:MAG: hypothetical protein GEU83_08485 [Pseudonocardiaceae bacterium]|nr:hypothetical protein [Pseudonocardiaceae bacterium]
MPPTIQAAQPPGVDVEAVNADLADNGVAAPGDQGPLAAEVEQAAAEHDLQLSVVVVPEPAEGAQLQALARQVVAERGGTALVLSPENTGAASATFEGDTVTEAANSVPGGDNAAATGVFVDELTDPGPPWGWLLVAGAVLLVAVAVGGRWWERRTRRRKHAAALAEEGKRLRSEVAAMADELLAADRRMPLQDDSTLTSDFDKIAIEYRELSHAVERDPVRRRDADALSARVRTARERLERITQTLDGRAQS